MLPDQLTPPTSPETLLTCPVETTRRLIKDLTAPMGCRTSTHDRYIQGAICHAVPEADWIAMDGVARFAPPDRPLETSVNELGETLSNLLEHYRYLLPIVMDRMILFKLKQKASEIAYENKVAMPADMPLSAFVDTLYEMLSRGALPSIEQSLLTREDIFTAHVIAAVELKQSLHTEAELLSEKASQVDSSEMSDYLIRAEALHLAADKISLPSGAFAYNASLVSATLTRKIFGDAVFRPLSIVAHRLNDVGTPADASHAQRLSINSSLRKFGLGAGCVLGALYLSIERPSFLLAGASIAGLSYGVSWRMDAEELELYQGCGIQNFDAWAANQLTAPSTHRKDLPSLYDMRAICLRRVKKCLEGHKDAIIIRALSPQDINELAGLCNHIRTITTRITLLESRAQSSEEICGGAALDACLKRVVGGIPISEEGLMRVISDIQQMLPAETLVATPRLPASS